MQILRSNDPKALSKTPPVKIEGADGLYQIHQGDFRISYQVDRGRLIVLIVRIGARGDICKEV